MNASMNPCSKLVASALTISLLACAGCSGNQPKATPESSATAEPSAESSSAPSETITGRATWYGPGFYGNKTASGEVLQKDTMTAAHSKLQMGTKVKVTREDTNESVIVVINDRKPFKEGTVIDLAHGAAEELDLDDDGEAVVSLEVLD
jgi:rare lipoprotein A